MACTIVPEPSGRSPYHGLAEIFEYTNDDGELYGRNCGQAAAATLLTSRGVWQPDADLAVAHMGRLERYFPPDNFGGYLVTSRRCMERICQAHRLPVIYVAGEESLRRELDLCNPVVVMLGVPLRRAGIPLPGGHWLVAYGYDDESIFLTNWEEGHMPWPEFRRRWRSWVAWLIRMRRRGLAVRRPAAPAAAP